VTSLFSNTTARHLIYSRFLQSHFIFTAYDTEKGELLYTSGGTCTLNGSSYTEHVDFGDRISAGIVGKDQQFTVKIDGDTFM